MTLIVALLIVLLQVRENCGQIDVFKVEKINFSAEISPRVYFAYDCDISCHTLPNNRKIWYSLNGFFCTGVMIHSEWILTVASCFNRNNGTDDDYDILVLGHSEAPVNVEDKVYNTFAYIRGVESIIIPHNKSVLGNENLSLVKVTTDFPLLNSMQILKFEYSTWSNIDKSGCYMSIPEEGKLQDLSTQTYYEPYFVNSLFLVYPLHDKNGCPCTKNDSDLWKQVLCTKVGKQQYHPHMCQRNLHWSRGSPITCGNKLLGLFIGLMDVKQCDLFLGKCNGTSNDIYSLYIYTCPYLSWISKYVPGVPKTPDYCKLSNQNMQKYFTLIIFIVCLSGILFVIYLYLRKFYVNSNSKTEIIG